MPNLPFKPILEIPVTAMPFQSQVQVIGDWAKQQHSRFVCVANVHMLVEAHWQPKFAAVLQQADVVTPDGMPLVWMLKALGMQQPERVAGMDLFLALCKHAEEHQVSVYFLGSQPEILKRMAERLGQMFPQLQIAGMESPPFRPPTEAERQATLQTIRESGAGLVFVSLGCPKQEQWMSQNRDEVPAVLVGVGGVFPVFAGIQKRAPSWIRNWGLEWLFRWAQEPRRLCKRYITTNSTFLYLVARQLGHHCLDAARGKHQDVRQPSAPATERLGSVVAAQQSSH
jgi:N-acetylglucosaminyldiphosphoundecaprenol N-acetyl-beta-D-mannosaminyltransferase